MSKQNPAEAAVEQTEAENNPRARNRYYMLAAQSGEKKNPIILDCLCANSLDEAKESFEDLHGKAPMAWHDGSDVEKGKGGNGFYLAMGTGASAAQRISVTVTPKQLAKRTDYAFEAHFQGWKVYGNGLAACTINKTEYDDNELVSIEFDELVDKNNKVDKPKLKKKEVVRLSSLSNIEQL